jgi:hypothetical protein
MAQVVLRLDAPELEQIVTQLDRIEERVSLMATQAQVDAISGNITAAVGQINTALAGIRQDIEDLRAQANVDVGPLEARVAEVTAAAQSLTDLDVENPTPPQPF